MSALSQTALAHEANQDLPLAAESASVFDDATERQMAAVELRLNFCAQLKAARERKGISLQEISDATKISESIFADFERCDVSRWPLGIYRRAFFRGYAGLIGLPRIADELYRSARVMRVFTHGQRFSIGADRLVRIASGADAHVTS